MVDYRRKKYGYYRSIAMSRVLTQTQLSKMPCSDPNCDHAAGCQMYLHGRCHPGGGLALTRRSIGQWLVLDILCHVCHKTICMVAVETLTPLFDPCCDGKLEICYHEGLLLVHCYTCKRAIATFEVSS